MTYPDGRVVDSNLGADGSLGSITEPAGSGTPGGTYLSGITRNIGGQLTGDTLGNGVIETWGFDANRLQLTSQTAKLSSNTLISLNYSYQAAAGQMGAGTTAGNAGQLMAINNSSQILGSAESAAYTYDLLGRLSTSSETTNASTTNRRFTYDEWGNRLTVFDATSGGNQIENISLAGTGGVPTNQIQSATINGANHSYTYDANGNVTSDGVNTYQYDAENQLSSINSGAILYSYDWFGRRIRKTVGSAKTEYVWDGNQVIAEYNAANGAHDIDYVYWAGKLIAEAPGTLLGGNGSTTFLLQDKQGIRVSMDRSGNVLGRQAALPFGEETGESGTQEKHHFTTYEADAETGLDFAFHRFYNQAAGRFMSADSITSNQHPEDPQSWNRYSYVENKPKDNTDPLGLFCQADEDFFVLALLENGVTGGIIDTLESWCDGFGDVGDGDPAANPPSGTAPTTVAYRISQVRWSTQKGGLTIHLGQSATLTVVFTAVGIDPGDGSADIDLSADVAKVTGATGPDWNPTVSPEQIHLTPRETTFTRDFMFSFNGTLGKGVTSVSVTGEAFFVNAGKNAVVRNASTNGAVETTDNLTVDTLSDAPPPPRPTS